MQMQLTLITPERRLTLLNLRQVVFQTPQGETGMLPGHAALVSLCACGIVRAFRHEADANDPPLCFVVGTGSVRAFDDHVVLLTKRMRCENELDAEETQAELDEVITTLTTLDPILDQEDYDDFTRDAAFCEAVLALDRELSQRHPNLTSTFEDSKF
jgi:F0F1-type ATP synthase epsilon subunit